MIYNILTYMMLLPIIAQDTAPVAAPPQIPTFIHLTTTALPHIIFSDIFVLFEVIESLPGWILISLFNSF